MWHASTPRQHRQVSFWPTHIFTNLRLALINFTSFVHAVPATSQITYSKAITSTSIKFEWSSAQGADKYILVVNGTFHPETHNLTFTSLSGQIDNLQRSTSYSCYIYSANSAGLGAKSLVRTIRTCKSTQFFPVVCYFHYGGFGTLKSCLSIIDN